VAGRVGLRLTVGIVVGMDLKADVREFLSSRRARLTPEQLGLAGYDDRRRVAGLRREEVAELANVSVDYYVRMERGNLAGVSHGVLEATARALRLSQAERAHLFDLARAANAPALTPNSPPSVTVRPTVQQLLDSMNGPAWVRDASLNFLAANRLGRALYAPMLALTTGTPNKARFVFLADEARRFYPDWPTVAKTNAALLRAEVGRAPHDQRLTDLVDELSDRSDVFRSLWTDHDVAEHRAGRTQIRHPVVGHLDLAYEAMQLTADVGLTMVAYGADPGSPTEQALKLLESWAATEESSQPDDQLMPASRFEPRRR
jgi:transcriptional regulator with XRE-family HTH domain